MSEDKGSHNVSLGPYRSTELVLEERLTKKEASEMAKLMRQRKFGLIDMEDCDYSTAQIVDIISVLGYQQKTVGLFVRVDGKFVYLSEAGNSQIKLASGNYEGSLERILSDMDIVKDIADCSRKMPSVSDQANYGLLTFAGIVGLVTGIPLAMVHLNAWGIIYLAGSGIITAYCLNKGSSRKYLSKMQESASLLSKTASQYYFGRTVYDQILSEYHAKAMISLSQDKLVSPETKQLPEAEENKK